MFLLVPAHLGSPGQRAVKRLLLLLPGPPAPAGAIALHFGMWPLRADITDIITRAKFLPRELC